MSTTENTHVSTVTVDIGGMSCAACALTIEKAVASLPGVASAAVNLSAANARIAFDPKETKIEAITKAITDAGYRPLGIRGDGFETVDFFVNGLGGTVGVAETERHIAARRGVISVVANQAASTVRIVHDSTIVARPRLEGLLAALGLEPTAGGERTPFAAADEETARLRRRLVSSAAAGILLFALAMGEMAGLLGRIDHTLVYLVEAVLSLAIMAINRAIYRAGLRSLFIARRPNMDSLVAIGTLTAFLASAAAALFGAADHHGMKEVYFESAGLILVFITLGKYLESRAKGSTLEALRKLIELSPKTVSVIRDGVETRIPAGEVEVGDLIIVRAGEQIPVDGVIAEGSSSIDESSVTGEPMPRDKAEGDEVVGGTMNRDGVIRMTATRVGAETVIARIAKTIEEAQGTKPKIQRSVDTVAAIFVQAVFAVAVVTFVVWVAAGADAVFALKAFVSVLIISCPCALGLATPTAVAMSTGIFARRGILIKDAETIERTAKVAVFAFDKTGTLTLGRPRIDMIVAAPGHDEREALILAASVECRSDHPLACAVMERIAADGVSYDEATDITTYPGKGITGFFGVDVVTVGNPAYVAESGYEMPPWAESGIVAASQLGSTVLVVAGGAEVIGVITMSDTIAPDAKETIDRLKRRGCAVYLLTGDSEGAARETASALGLDGYFGGLLPEDKLARIAELRSRHGVVAMVGDGINDAPSLASADVGIAMGHGTEIAIESSGAVVTTGDLTAVPAMVAISRYTLRKIRQNLFWAFAYNAAMIPLAAGVFYPLLHALLSPTVAGAAMAVSSVSVVSNSLIMRRYG